MTGKQCPMAFRFLSKLALASAALIAIFPDVSASAADLAPVYRKAPVQTFAPAPTWSGFYVGGNVGYGWDKSSSDLVVNTTDPALAGFLAAFLVSGSLPATMSPAAKGIIGGGQVGYNVQMPSQQWLIGLEADLQSSRIRGTDSQLLFPLFFDQTSTTLTKSIDWFGTVRGRIGFLANPQWLLYATGGLAYGQTKISFNELDVTSGCIPNATICADGSSSSVRAGWTAGGGVEAMLAPNWSFKLEYLYVDLGRRSLSLLSSTSPITFDTALDFHEHVVRAGLNYHFNSSGPVVAKY
jgi:outer membrane immunogenic protein